MKRTKSEWMPLYSYLDRSAITAHLTDMASRGWMLERLGGWGWRYRRTEPKKLRFAVTFFPAASQFDAVPSEGLETYRDYCAAAGWHLAAEAAQVQVFYTEDEDAVPIETDPAVELDNIRQSAKKGAIGSYWALLILALFQLAFQFYQIWTNPVETLSSSAQLSAVLGWVPLSLLAGAELIRYYRWRRSATAAAEAGLPLPNLKSTRWLGILMLVWANANILWMLGSYWHTKRMFLMMAGIVLFMGLLVLLANAAKYAMKRLKAPRWVNLAATFGVILVLTIGGTTALGAWLIGGSGSGWLEAHPPAETYEYQGMTWRVYHDHIPLRIEDLAETDYDRWSTQAQVDSTFLLTREVYTQLPRMDALEQPELRYELIKVRQGVLYDLCKNDFVAWVERDNDSLPAEFREEYRLIDAPAWGAGEVYQRYSAGEAVNQFLVCWPDCIAEIKLDGDWVVTDEMASAAAKALHPGD